MRCSMVAEGCHSEKKQINNKQIKKSSMCFRKIFLYKKIINKLNLLKLLKQYSEAKLL